LASTDACFVHLAGTSRAWGARRNLLFDESQGVMFVVQNIRKIGLIVAIVLGTSGIRTE